MSCCHFAQSSCMKLWPRGLHILIPLPVLAYFVNTFPGSFQITEYSIVFVMAEGNVLNSFRPQMCTMLSLIFMAPFDISSNIFVSHTCHASRNFLSADWELCLPGFFMCKLIHFIAHLRSNDYSLSVFNFSVLSIIIN